MMTLGVVLFHSGIQLSGCNECPIIARINQTYVLICLTISLSLVRASFRGGQGGALAPPW